MSFLNKLFGNKKTVASILASTQRDVFDIYGVTRPTDAQKMKASVYICIAGIAILNDLGGGRLSHLIDKLVEETKELTKPLSMRIGELSNSKEDLKKILSDFPEQIQMNESTVVNGLAGFEALYFAKGEKLMNDILSHNGGPLGAPGYASIVVADGIFGEGKSKEYFMQVSMRMLAFARELTEAI